MHLLFDARLLHRPLSGLERVQRNLLRELGERAEIERLRVLVMHGTRLPDTFPRRAEVVAVHGTEDVLRVLLHPDLDQRPDLYHLSWFPDRNPRDLWLPIAARASVVEVHDAILNRHPEYHPSRASWQWYHDFVRQLVRSCDRLLCHSRSVVREVERDLDGDPAIADVAPLAVEPSLRTPLPADEVRTRLSRLRVHGDYFLAVGKDYPHKDHATMFRALARQPRRVQAVIAGSQVWHGPESTRTLLQELGLTDSVRWIEGLDDDDVKALLQGAKALVYPSLEEGFGLPPIEAMALGCPVLAADAMSIPEVCGDGAWLFRPGDDQRLAGMMQSVLAGGDEIRQLVARGREREQQYSWRRCADLVIECYRNALQASMRRRRRRATLPADLRGTLEVIARAPFNESRELAAWQERCLSVEHTLRELRAGVDRPAEIPPQAGGPATGATSNRPRWSLRRRIQKIRDGLRGQRKGQDRSRTIE